MNLELDHLFICSQINAPEIEHLLNLGLVEGRSNVHPGQGTANRCIFWQNFMLEFLYVINENEVSSSVISPTNLRERWNYCQTGYSPFGIACRRIATDSLLPFATWAYKPPYLTEQLQIDIARDTRANEPLLFVVPFHKPSQPKPINHPAKIQQVTGVQITISSSRSFSQPVNAINQAGLVKFVSGSDNLATIEFDHRRQQREKDFRPHLPLIFRW